jgi:hypothetical protein
MVKHRIAWLVELLRVIAADEAYREYRLNE